jgi:hypothetical protein
LTRLLSCIVAVTVVSADSLLLLLAAAAAAAAAPLATAGAGAAMQGPQPLLWLPRACLCAVCLLQAMV